MNTASARIPLPTVNPANIPITNTPQSNNNLQLAQTLNLFNKGGIASVRK